MLGSYSGTTTSHVMVVSMMGFSDGPKVMVRHGSDDLKGIERDFKVKIDDIRERIDLND